MSERYKRFTISSNQEEFDCPTCGCPMYVGDRAVLVHSDDLECEYVTCSVTCHERELREWDRDQEHERKARHSDMDLIPPY